MTKHALQKLSKRLDAIALARGDLNLEGAALALGAAALNRPESWPDWFSRAWAYLSAANETQALQQ
jgi:hypothetical protein